MKVKINSDVINFFKINGFKQSRYIINTSQHPLICFGDGSYFHTNQLKQIVDAFELVESFGGLFQAKVTLYKEGFTGGIECGDRLIEDDVLKQAIELVEKCK